VLKVIEILLKDDTKEARIRRHVTGRAILSNEAIAKREVHSLEEVRSEVQEVIATYNVGKAMRSVAMSI
jgi:hypothetical protein